MPSIQQSFTEHSPRRVTRGVIFNEANEEQKEEEDQDEDLGQQIVERLADDGDFDSPERPRRNIQEQQTCWRHRNASIEASDNNQEARSPEPLVRAMDRVQQRQDASQDQRSPDPVRIPPLFF